MALLLYYKFEKTAWPIFLSCGRAAFASVATAAAVTAVAVAAAVLRFYFESKLKCVNLI